MPSPPGPRSSRQSRRILVVEDEGSVPGQVRDLFAAEGFPVQAVRGGPQVLDALPPGAGADLVVLDLAARSREPGAFRVAQERSAVLAGLPLLVLGAQAEPGEADAVVAFLARPFTAAQLIGAAERLLLVRDLAAAEQGQRRSEESFRSFLERSPDPVLIHRMESVLYANPAFIAYVGAPGLSALLGTDPLGLLHPDTREQAAARNEAARGGAASRPLVHRLLCPGGDKLAEFVGVPVLFEGSPAIASLGRDVTEKLRREEALRAAEERLHTVLTNAPVALYAADTAGRITLAEGRGLEAFGLHQSVGSGVLFFESFAQLGWLVESARVALRGEPSSCQGAVAGKHFEVLHRPLRDAAGAVTGLIGVGVDVTERRQMESQLLLSDRLASMGRLAAGVAHEINNPLAYVALNLDFIIRELAARPQPGNGELLHAAREAQQGAERVRHAMQDLKALTRTGEALEALELSRVLDSSIHIAANEIRHRARLVVDYEPAPKVFANEARLGQVFLNLLVNAAQAISEGQVDANEIKVSLRARPGEAVVEISDTGAGIPAEIKARLFDPFFTTKEIGEGTGLGLAIARSTVESLAGRIEVESEPGKGSLFRVVLPAGADQRTAAGDAPTPPPAPPAPPAKTPGRGRILVIDDEPAIGRAVKRLLSTAHEVETETRAQDALARLDRGETFDVILCDLMMPEMTGMELHAEIARRFPPLADRMAFMTGGAFTGRAQEFLESVMNPRIEKPMQLGILRELIAEWLGR